MPDFDALERLRGERLFSGWDGFVKPGRIAASEASIRHLIEDVLSLGRELSEKNARAAVVECVRRFNDLDDGWICTIEREHIYEQIGRVIELCGFVYDEDWLGEREW